MSRYHQAFPDSVVNTLRSISMLRPLHQATLHRFMEQLVGRKIVVDRAPDHIQLTGVCGLWLTVEGEGCERIYFANTESDVHRQQFIYHEFGHMVLGHTKPLLGVEGVAHLAPLVPLDAVVHALSRSSFTDEQEAFAEMVGDHLALLMRSESREPSSATYDAGFGRVL